MTKRRNKADDRDDDAQDGEKKKDDNGLAGAGRLVIGIGALVVAAVKSCSSDHAATALQGALHQGTAFVSVETGQHKLILLNNLSVKDWRTVKGIIAAGQQPIKSDDDDDFGFLYKKYPYAKVHVLSPQGDEICVIEVHSKLLGAMETHAEKLSADKAQTVDDLASICDLKPEQVKAMLKVTHTKNLERFGEALMHEPRATIVSIPDGAVRLHPIEDLTKSQRI